MNIEGRGVYELTTISVRWLPVSAIQFLSENNLIKLITHIYEFTGGVTRNIKRRQVKNRSKTADCPLSKSFLYTPLLE